MKILPAMSAYVSYLRLHVPVAHTANYVCSQSGKKSQILSVGRRILTLTTHHSELVESVSGLLFILTTTDTDSR